MNSIAKPTLLSVCLLGLIALISLIAQIGLMSVNHKPSFLNIIVWTGAYIAICVGLVQKRQRAYNAAILMSVAQLFPAILMPLPSIGKLIGLMPEWYVYKCYFSAVLGVVLLITLLNKHHREVFNTGATG